MSLSGLVTFIDEYVAKNPSASKDQLAEAAADRFSLRKDRKLYVGDDLAVRFCRSSSDTVFSGCVLAIAKVVAHDKKPLVVCLRTPDGCKCMLANTTFVQKVSHSSKTLELGNLRGTILGSNILKKFNGLANEPQNFAALWAAHDASDMELNLARIVNATHDIVATAPGWIETGAGRAAVLAAPQLAKMQSTNTAYLAVKAALDKTVASRRSSILDAASIDNVKDRGERIEALITSGSGEHGVGDLECQLGTVAVLVDVKSKLAGNSSAPKAYNIDKVLTELARGNRLISIYFVLVDLNASSITTRFVSIFDATLVAASVEQHHWSGRGTRGAIQFSGAVEAIWAAGFVERIDLDVALRFLTDLIKLQPSIEDE